MEWKKQKSGYVVNDMIEMNKLRRKGADENVALGYEVNDMIEMRRTWEEKVQTRKSDWAKKWMSRMMPWSDASE